MGKRFLKIFRWLSTTEDKDKILPRYLKCLLFWNPFISVVMNFIMGGTDFFWQRNVISTAIACVVTTFAFGLPFIISRIEGALIRKMGGIPPKRGRGWSWGIAAVAVFPGLYVGFLIASPIAGWLGRSWEIPGIRDYGFGVFFGLLIFGLFILAQMHRDARESAQAAKLQMKELENAKLKAEIAALTAQMNPHLLFNALNTIASMIPTDPQAAEETTVRLSELYRGVLNSSDKIVHSLAKELEICESYLAIEKARFGPRLTSSIEIEKTVDIHKVEIPALTIQPLVENAVRHGIGPRSTAGHIRVGISDANGSGIRISVEDNGVGFGKSPSRPGTGTGIANCRSRLKLQYGDSGKMEVSQKPEGGTVALLQIPKISMVAI